MKANMRSLFRSGTLRTQLLRGGAGSMGLKAANIGLSLAAAVVLARFLGPTEYGIYAYVFVLISFLSIPAQFGLPALVVRETAKAEANREWGLMRGLWRWAGLSAATLALVLAIVGGVLAWLFQAHFSVVEIVTFAWGLVMVPLIVFGGLSGAALRGLRKVVQGQLPEQLIRPALLVAMVLIAGGLAGGRITANHAMALHVLAAAVAFAIGIWLLKRESPRALRERPAATYQSRRWLASTWPLAFAASLSLINTQTDILMLGIFAHAHDVGVYRVASRGATLVGFGYMAVAMATMPHFARFHALHDMVRFQKLATLSARASLALAIPVMLVYLFFGKILLGRVFGAAFVDGYFVLVILGGAQLVHSTFAVLGPLLNMSGYERDTARCGAVAAVANVVLNLVMIPLYGMTGAAIASAISLLGWLGILWWTVHRRLGVDCSIFGVFSRVRAATTG